MLIIRILIVLLLAIALPYLGVAFVEQEWRVEYWHYWGRIALVAVYALYLLLLVQLLTERADRKGPAGQ